MPSIGRMCYLTTVPGSFHGRVLAARLGAEGILVVLKETSDSNFPLRSVVDVLVPADQLAVAREVLLADAIDDAFGHMDLGDLDETGGQGSGIDGGGMLGTDLEDGYLGGPRESGSLPFPRHRPPIRGWAAVAVYAVVAMIIAASCLAVVVH